jgi:hypothetical protein
MVPAQCKTESGEPPESKEPKSEQDVWIELTVTCEPCTPGGVFALYGKPGDSAGGMPSLYYEREGPAYPLSVRVEESSMMGKKKPFPRGRVTLRAFHDANGKGMGPEPGEPVSEPVTLELKAGEPNKLHLQLK